MMRHVPKHLPTLATAVCAVALVATACAAPTTGSGPGAKGASISLLTAALPETLNPVAGFSNTGKGKINESLMTLRPRAKGELPQIVPHLAAAEPQVSADGLVWTLTLRPGVTFSDGSALTAEDVVATYRAVQDPASASPIAGDLVNLKEVRAQGETTVVFTLKAPQVSFRTALLIGIAPSEKLTAGQKVESSPLSQQPVGSGPYQVESFRPDRLVLVANPRYRGPAPQMERIVYALAEDDNTRAQRMRAGDFDGSVLPPRLAGTFAKSSDLEVVAASSADWRGISLPADNPVTTDPAMRMALNIGIDREAMVKGVLVGHGRPASTFIPPQYGAFHDPSAVFTYDLPKAKTMLDQAGWKPGAGGIRVKNGTRAAFTLMYRPTDLVRRDLAAAFASDALALGVDVRLEGVEFAQAEGRVGKDSIMLGGGDTPYDVDSQVYKSLHSTYPAAGAYYDNPSRYADKAMDAALDQGRTSADQDARVAAYQRVQQLYVKEPSMVLLAFVDHTYVQKKSIRNQWTVGEPILEPHEHGTAWGPWVDIDTWTRR